MGGLHEDVPRKVWGGSPDSQVLRVLQEAELQPLTQQLENVTICEEDFSSPGSSSSSLFLPAKLEFKCLTTCNISFLHLSAILRLLFFIILFFPPVFAVNL